MDFFFIDSSNHYEPEKINLNCVMACIEHIDTTYRDFTGGKLMLLLLKKFSDVATLKRY